MKYAVIVDAGSTGSRAFVYTWPDAESYLEGLSPDSILRDSLLPIETTKLWVNKIQPGISSFRGNTKSIWNDHLSPLLGKLKDVVPKEQQKETSVYFLATAGLRMLEKSEQSEILGEVCRLLQKKTNFYVPDCESHVTMIDGQTEGLYGWLGLNYLIHWSLSKNWRNFNETYGFLDMGGASAQLAFASSPDSKRKKDLHKIRIRAVSGELVEWNIFVTTWLGYGANQARSRFRDLLVAEMRPEEMAGYEQENAPVPVLDPCMPVGATEIGNTESGKHCVFLGSGQWQQCENYIFKLLATEVPCEDDPCLFNGVHVPDFDISKSKFVGVSEYWYTLQDIFNHRGKFEYQNLEQRVKDFCKSDWNQLSRQIADGKFTKADGSKLNEDDIQKACFKSAWVLTVLNKGFKFPLTTDNPALEHNFQDTFQSALEIEGTEISWTLGRAVLFASSQIPPANENNAQPVGITTLDGQFFEGGGSTPREANAMRIVDLHRDWPSVNFWLVVTLFVVAISLTLRFTSLGHKFYHSRMGKKARKTFNSWLPSIEQQFQEQTASSIGYGNTYPHAGIPLSNFERREPHGISTLRPPIQTPSRVGSRINLTGHED